MNINFNELVKLSNKRNVYMIIGNGTKNQFKNLLSVKAVVKNILKTIEPNSILLYFGDKSDKKKPDVGYVYELISKNRKDIDIILIQINKAKKYGFPSFVKYLYWHNDFKNDNNKYGGLNSKGEPCSNTKKWISLHKRLKEGIKNVFILSGGNITLQEYTLIEKYDIPYSYYPLIRKYKGDGNTKIKNNDNIKTKIGQTYKKIK